MTKSILTADRLAVCPDGKAPSTMSALLEAIQRVHLATRDAVKLTKMIKAHAYANGNGELIDPGTGHLTGPVKGLKALGLDVSIINGGKVGNGSAFGPGFKSRDDRESAAYLVELNNSAGKWRTTPSQWTVQTIKRDGARLWYSDELRLSILRKGKRLITEAYTALDNNKEQLLLVSLAELIHPFEYSTDLL